MKQKGDTVTLWCEDYSKHREKILTFSIAALCNQFDYLEPRELRNLTSPGS